MHLLIHLRTCLALLMGEMVFDVQTTSCWIGHGTCLEGNAELGLWLVDLALGAISTMSLLLDVIEPLATVSFCLCVCVRW